MKRERYKFKKYGKDFFKNLKEKSVKEYGAEPALNWGTTKKGKYTIDDRYFLEWCRPEMKNNLHKIDVDVKEYILSFREKIEKEERELFIFIGVDSQNKLLKTSFVATIVLYIGKNGGHELVAKKNLNKIYDYRYRLLREADILGEIGRELCPFLKENKIPFELHLDYNASTNHKSNGVVVEAFSYLRNLGMKPKIKPEAWAASSAADYFCR